MPDNSIEEMIARLEARKAEIETTLAVLRREQLTGDAGAPVAATAPKPPVQETREIAVDEFFGMSVPEATKKYLQAQKRPQTTTEIAGALRKGGIQSTAKSFTTSVYTTIARRNDLVRVGDKWALREWYPSLRGQVKTKAPQNGAEAEAETPTEESPSGAPSDPLPPS